MFSAKPELVKTLGGRGWKENKVKKGNSHLYRKVSRQYLRAFTKLWTYEDKESHLCCIELP